MDNSSKRRHNLCRATQIHIHQHLPDFFMHNSCGREKQGPKYHSQFDCDGLRKGAIKLCGVPLTGPWKCHLPPLCFSSYDPTGFMGDRSVITFIFGHPQSEWHLVVVTALNAGKISPFQQTDESDFPLSAINNSSLRNSLVQIQLFWQKKEKLHHPMDIPIHKHELLLHCVYEYLKFIVFVSVHWFKEHSATEKIYKTKD